MESKKKKKTRKTLLKYIASYNQNVKFYRIILTILVLLPFTNSMSIYLHRYILVINGWLWSTIEKRNYKHWNWTRFRGERKKMSYEAENSDWCDVNYWKSGTSIAKNVNLFCITQVWNWNWFGTDWEFTDQGNVQVPMLSTFSFYGVLHGSNTVLPHTDAFSTTQFSG